MSVENVMKYVHACSSQIVLYAHNLLFKDVMESVHSGKVIKKSLLDASLGIK